jgi:hypothetical protein
MVLILLAALGTGDHSWPPWACREWFAGLVAVEKPRNFAIIHGPHSWSRTIIRRAPVEARSQDESCTKASRSKALNGSDPTRGPSA